MKKMIFCVLDGFYDILNWISNIKSPWRERYWLLREEASFPGMSLPLGLIKEDSDRKFEVIRNKYKPMRCNYEVIDGPFDTQEDVVRAMAFWKSQFTKDSNLKNQKR